MVMWMLMLIAADSGCGCGGCDEYRDDAEILRLIEILLTSTFSTLRNPKP